MGQHAPDPSLSPPYPAPIFKSLPTEIFRHIFSMCCLDGDGITVEVGEGAPPKTATPMPVVLSSVSSRWRAIAISSQNLWSSLTFVMYLEWEGKKERRNKEEAEKCLRITERCLERAGNAPLTLAFSETAWVYEVSEDEDDGGDHVQRNIQVGDALDALCRRAGQWVSVKLHVHDTFLQYGALRHLRGKLINLRTLVLTVMSKDEVTDFLGPCPSLRNVEIDGAWEGPSPTRCLKFPHFPWMELEQLSLVISPGLQWIVSKCSNLRHLSVKPNYHIGDRDFSASTDSSSTYRTSSTFQSLSLAGTSFIYTRFLQYITAHHLTSLDLHGTKVQYANSGSYYLTEWQERCLSAFLHRSSCPITFLSLRYSCLFEEQVVRLLELLPKLTKVCILEARKASKVNALFTKRLLDHLFVDTADSSPNSPGFLRRLTHLEVEVYGQSLDHQAFVDAILSRWIPDPEVSSRLGVDSVQSVSVKFIDGMAGIPDSWARLEECRSAGLNVSVSEAS